MNKLSGRGYAHLQGKSTNKNITSGQKSTARRMSQAKAQTRKAIDVQPMSNDGTSQKPSIQALRRGYLTKVAAECQGVT